jgi:hypothetical protein
MKSQIQRTSVLLVMALCGATLSRAQTPAEVTDLQWCAVSNRSCLQWTPVAGAGSYFVYIGEGGTGLNCLVNDRLDASWREEEFTPTGAQAYPEIPNPGRFYWYLVTARNDSGEGPAGDATTGPRRLGGTSNSTAPCRATGTACADPTQCCSGVCSNNVCAKACCGVEVAAACEAAQDCCSDACLGGACCVGVFQSCSNPTECCTGGCNGSCCYPDGTYAPGCFAPCCNGCAFDICGASCGGPGAVCSNSLTCCSHVCSLGHCG